MIAAKGYDVSVVLVGGKTVKAPRGAALLHDEDGAAWPRCSALIALFRTTREPLGATPQWVRGYFGAAHTLRRGSVVLPPRSLSGWTLVGRCESVDYRREGVHADEYTHPFGERGGATWLTRHPKLFRLGRDLRIELGRGCVWNWRGIVRP